MEAVRKGASIVGIRGNDCVILGVEKRSIPKLQEQRTIRKVCKVDDHILFAFAGLNADARVLIDKARVECQSYRLSVEVPPTVEYVARYVAKVQQRYTQRGGMRPFGISCLIAGLDDQRIPQLWLTDPSGAYNSWKANATGKNGKSIREFLEKNYVENMNQDECVKLTIRSLNQYVENGAKSMEIYVIKKDGVLNIPEDEIQNIITQLPNDHEEDNNKK